MSRVRDIWWYFAGGILLTLLGGWVVGTHFSFVADQPGFPWMYRQGLLCSVFLGLGGLGWKYEEKIRRWLSPWLLAVASAVYVAVEVGFYHDVRCTLSASSLNLLGVVVSCIGCLLVAALCGWIGRSGFLRFVGRNSIGMYFLSGGVPMVTALLIRRLLPSASLAGLLLVFVLSVGIALAVVKLLAAYAPWVFNLRELPRFGNRNQNIPRQADKAGNTQS